MRNPQKTLRLLPNYFKKVGLGLIIFILLLLPFSQLLFSYISISDDKRHFIFILLFNFILVGLLLFSLAKDKIEDELTLLYRITAMASAFIAGTVFLIVSPVTNLLFSGKPIEATGAQLVLYMLLFYLLIFNYLKRKA